jgi:hypothetical protein
MIFLEPKQTLMGYNRQDEKLRILVPSIMHFEFRVTISFLLVCKETHIHIHTLIYYKFMKQQ